MGWVWGLIGMMMIPWMRVVDGVKEPVHGGPMILVISAWKPASRCMEWIKIIFNFYCVPRIGVYVTIPGCWLCDG